MDVEVKHRLTGRRAVVLDNVKARGTESLLHGLADLARKRKRLARSLFRKLGDVAIVLFRQHQRVPLGRGAQIQNHAKALILTDFRRRNFSVCDFTENAIVLSHPYASSFRANKLAAVLSLLYSTAVFLSISRRSISAAALTPALSHCRCFHSAYTFILPPFSPSTCISPTILPFSLLRDFALSLTRLAIFSTAKIIFIFFLKTPNLFALSTVLHTVRRKESL